MHATTTTESELSFLKWCYSRIARPIYRHLALLLCITFLSLGSLILTAKQSDVHASWDGSCTHYRVATGDVLWKIARNYHTTVWKIASTNNISNINLIFVGQRLCIGANSRRVTANTIGVQANGSVRWYAYNALGWGEQNQTTTLLRYAAARYGLPANLLLAIAWQESGWRQHVISHDGGIGVMQVMPYTAMGLNRQSGNSYNPYQLWDNIELGTLYLHDLWIGFHGHLPSIISAYNEGGGNVKHRGIFNWHYVNSVMALMRNYR